MCYLFILITQLMISGIRGKEYIPYIEQIK